MKYDKLAAMMTKAYDSDARQMQVKSKLETLRLRTFMSENSITEVASGLSKLVNHFTNLAPQCHPHFRTETDMIDYLHRVVAEFTDWSLNSIQRITSRNLTINALVTSLNEAIRHRRELLLLTGASPSQDSPPDCSIKTAHTETHDTFILKYGNPPRYLKESFPHTRHRRNYSRPRKSPPRSISGKTFDECRRRQECYKCSGPWKPGHRCPQRSIRGQIRDRLRSGTSAVHLVSDLVQSHLVSDLV